MSLIISNNNHESQISKWVPRNTTLAFVIVIVNTITNPATLGYDSMMMGSLNALPQYKSYFKLENNPVLLGWMSASMWCGNLIGCFVIQYTSDTFGRRKSILLANIICCVGVILQTCAVNIGMFSSARVILGLGTILSALAAPLLIAELTPAKIRGSVLGAYFTCYLIGALIASGVSYATMSMSGNWCWRLPSVIQALPSLVSMLVLIFIPESPRWLISRNRVTEASEIIEIFQRKSKDEARILVDNIVLSINEEYSCKSSNPWKLIFTGNSNRRKLFIMLTQLAITELGGSSVGSFYLSLMLDQAGITSTKNQLQVTVVSSSWGLVVSVIGSLVFDKLGRKPQSLIATTGMIIMFCVLGALIKIHANPYGCVAAMFLFSGFYNFAWTPINCLYPSEIWTFKTRTAGITLFKFFNCSFGLVATFILPIAMDNMGWRFYFINAGYDLLFIPCIYFVWVETKGLELEQVEDLFWDDEGSTSTEEHIVFHDYYDDINSEIK